MKLYALGEGCHVLTFKNTTIMLDCALDWGNQTSSWDFIKRNVIQNDPSSGTKSMLNLLNRTNRLNVNSLSSTKITQQDLQTPSIVFKSPNFHKIDATQIDLIMTHK